MTQFSESQLEARGYRVTDAPPPGWDRTRPWVNDRTGEVRNVQIGIDPDWNHNTGALASRQRLNRLAGRLDDPGLNPGAARAEVRTSLESTAFLDFLSGAVDGDWPVAIAPGEALARIGERSRTVRLSSESVADYEGLEAEDWVRVQRILDAGGAFDEGGRAWQASIIVADDEDGNRQTYLGGLGREGG